MIFMKKASLYHVNSIESEIDVADPYRVTQLLLEGLIRFMVLSKAAISRQDIVEKNTLLAKSQSIINALLVSLDVEKGGEVAQNMQDLYVFAFDQLAEAVLDSDIAKIDSAINVIKNIKSGWDSIPQAEIQQALALKNGLQDGVKNV